MYPLQGATGGGPGEEGEAGPAWGVTGGKEGRGLGCLRGAGAGPYIVEHKKIEVGCMHSTLL